MREVCVDMFFCKRRYVKQAITEYLKDIETYKGTVCPTVILLGNVQLNTAFNTNVPVYRLFSVQRRPGKEVKVVINTVTRKGA